MINYEMLTDKELLKLVVQEKNGESITDNLVDKYPTLSDLVIHTDEVELLKIKGVGIKKAQQIKAVSELAKRLYCKSITNKSRISKPDDVANLMIPEMRFLKKEVVKVVILNSKGGILSIETLSVGDLNSSIVSPREVFNLAIRKSAAAIILVHNHPSGDTTPSQEDLTISKRISDGGLLLGIKLLDHVIIGHNEFLSLKNEGLF